MTIVVSPFSSAAACFQSYAPAGVVSLLSPGMAPLALPLADHQQLRLSFNDIGAPRDGLVPPSAGDINSLLAFVSSWDRRTPLLVHCWAGVSRSPAAGYVIACLRDGPGSERRLAEALRASAPFATPNPLLIELADIALRRERRMIEAIADIGRGRETGVGEPFTL